MENQNLTPNPMENQELKPEMRPAAPEMGKSVEAEKPKKKTGLKVLFALLVVAVLGGVGYFGYTNPELFRADVTEIAFLGTGVLAIPEYTADPTDNGLISVKVFAPTSGTFSEDIVSIKFKLKWSPVNAMSLNENSIVFDNDTLFSSADLKSVNTDTQGEAVVSFFSTNAVTITKTSDDLALMKLEVDINGTPGSEITLTVEAVEVIKEAPAPALYEASTRFTTITSSKISLLTAGANLRLLNAEATSDSEIVLRFSDFLLEVGTPVSYSIPGLGVTNVERGEGFGYDQKTVVLSTTNQVSGDVYDIEIISGLIGNIDGTIDITDNYHKATIEGFETGVSAVIVSSIDVNSSTEVVLNLSGPIDTSTVSPLNIILHRFTPAGESLTISNVEVVNNQTLRLTTSQHFPGANYFVRFSAMADTNALELSNNKVLNFFGFSVPEFTVSTLSPTSVTNDTEQVIVILGTNLDTVVSARLNQTSVAVTQQTSGALSVIVPSGFTEGVYDLTLTNAVGETLTLDNALVVSTSVQPMRIISSESRALPDRVAPDGTTEVTLWVLVEDPVDLANIDSVTIDLERIGGNRAQEMTKDTGTQPQNRQFYKYTTTVSTVIPTSTSPYLLDVEVRKGAEVAQGTVSITVTRDILRSVAPTIDQVYTNPASIAPDGVTEASISASVSDPDGADKIISVVADLGPVGAGFKILNPLDVAGIASELTTGWFQTDPFTLPSTTADGTYNITVTATDDTGEVTIRTLPLVVSTALTQPSINANLSYIAPVRSIPHDGKTPFTLHVMISDPNGVSDIDSVTAYFGVTGITPVTLLRDPNSTDSALSALYSSGPIVVPTTSPNGVHEIEIVAADLTGGIANLILQLDVTEKNIIGNAPLIFSDKSYATPTIAVNDGQTSITLYAFVRDDDGDLDSVVVNLSNVGQFGPETPPDFGVVGASEVAPVVGDGSCPTGSDVIVCMTPSFKEGADGQWFVLSGITVSTSTPASSEPYPIEVIATDLTGKVSRGEILISVSSAESSADDSAPPSVEAAVPSAPGIVEVAFSEELAAISITSNGAEFTITESDDVSKELNIINASINAAGNVVTLSTDSQVPGREYALTATSAITDATGVSLISGKKLFFKGFTASDKPPVVHYIAATDPETIEIEFQAELKPSSVKMGSGRSDYNIAIFDSATNAPLTIHSVQFIDSGRTLQIVMDPMRSSTRYRAEMDGLVTGGGGTATGTITKFFKSINLRAIQSIRAENQADLNGDGKVDFIDFTMFSAQYGKVFGDSGAGQGLSPITPTPDATVPTTSSIPPQ